MPITALGYLGVRTQRLDDWRAYATGQIGLQQIDRGGQQIAFRMDNRQQRLVVSDEPGDPLAFIGWEVDSGAGLDALAATLSDAGRPVQEAPAELADRRYVGRLIVSKDPAGNRLEFFADPMLTEDPFVPGRPISGFKTGPYGMGHAVLQVKDASALMPFYRDVLGFRLSDFGLSPVPLYFFHVNGRHHSFAILGTGHAGFHHFMVEYTNLDDVGQGYDLAQRNEGRVAYTMGRHTNDWMTSFYTHTPSGFFIETGWGGRIIDPEIWQAEETFDGPSLWGHDRPYLPPEVRQNFRDMALGCGEKGVQAPPPTDCPWLYGVLSGQTG